MNKQREIQILLDCIESLGADSYTGPWLREQLPAIERALRSDIIPLITIQDARQRATDTKK